MQWGGGGAKISNWLDIPVVFLFDWISPKRKKINTTHTQRECVRVYVCVLDRKGNRVFASRTLLVVRTAVYLTGYSDWLTGFWEPLLLPYSCHTCLKNAQSVFWTA